MAVLVSTTLALTSFASATSSKATLSTFVGTWYGHTRGLKIKSTGYAKESIGDGCCNPIIDLKLRLSKPHGTKQKASIRARVTSVQVHDPSVFTPANPAPHVGQVRRLRLKHGVITEPLTGTVYCNMASDLKGKCGA